MRILLSEGSSLTSRQVATRLGELGHHVEILSSTSLCLTRFTRHVRKLHPVPAFGRDPFAWIVAAEKIAEERKIDVLFPTQEQVTVLSARQSTLKVATVVPAFESLLRVQDKISAFRTLGEAQIPQPHTILLKRVEDLAQIDQFPVFVKQPVSTASSGVCRAKTPDELQKVAYALGLGAHGLIAQRQSLGPLAMIQAIADNGRLIAHHANLRLREGVGGGASIKESVTIPSMPAHLHRLIEHLGWHGPISLDAILSDGGPVVIDINPRLVEPMNAYLAGVDLVGTMLGLAKAQSIAPSPAGRPGVKSHQLLLAILGAAQMQNSRMAVASEIFEALLRRGEYATSVEELTPIGGDPIAAIPVLAAALATLIRPDAWRLFHKGAVGPYALTPAAWTQIISMSDSAKVG